MATLTNLEIGSIVYNMVQNIPDVVSGTLSFQVDQAVFTAENYTGNDIPTNAIIETYQPAIINLTISNVLTLMEGQGLGTKSIKIDDLSTSKGLSEGTSQSFKEMGIKQLNDLGCKTSYYTSWN